MSSISTKYFEVDLYGRELKYTEFEELFIKLCTVIKYTEPSGWKYGI